MLLECGMVAFPSYKIAGFLLRAWMPLLLVPHDVQYDWCIFLAVSSQCSCSIWLRDVCALFHIEVIASAAFRWLSQDCICFGSAWTAFVFFSIPRSKDTLRSRLPYYVGLTLILEGSDEGRASESEDCAQ